MFKNIIFDNQNRQITITRDDYGYILSVQLLNDLIFSIEHSDQDGSFIHTLLNPHSELDKCTATALVAYLWNESQIELCIEGYNDFNHSNISLSYHIILKGIDIFDVTIGALEDPSYTLHLSSSEIKYKGLEAIQRCTHCVPDNLYFIAWEETHLSAICRSISVSSKTTSDDSAILSLNKEKEEDIESMISTPSSVHSEYIQLEESFRVDMDELITLCSGQFPIPGLLKAPIDNPNLTQDGEDYTEPSYPSQIIMVSSYPFLGQHCDSLVVHSWT